MSSKELTAFLAWAEENEILWDKAAIEIKETPNKHGLGVFAKKRLEPGYEAIQVPKAIVLSVQTTGIANLLSDDEIEGDTALTIGCMYELSRGAQSPWAAYLTLLTKRSPQMATALSKESREMMKLCEVYNDIEADIKDLQEDYESIVVPFIEKNEDVFTAEIKAKFFTLEAFRAMMEIVSSRSMDVDNFHVTALVPFADFVNHSPMPNADYLTHEDVCEICGALACEHMEDQDEDGSDDEDDEDNEDGSDDDEVPDLAGDDAPTAVATDKKSAKGKKSDETMDEDGEDWEDEDAEDDDEEINDTCDIILDDEVEKGEEITRHYGPYPNKVLLSKYGFAVEDNPHDTVTIQLDMVRQAAQRILKDEKLVEERTNWFLENEDAFIGADDDEEGGCCGGGDHDHDHDHEHGHGHEHHGHEHTEGDDCCAPKASKSKKQAAEGEAEDEADEEMEGDDEEEEDDEEDFPRDIMYMMHDGSIDDRLLMLLNVLFMEKDQFAKVQEDMEAAMEYFNDIFMRRQQEEHGDEDEDMEGEDEDEEEEGHEKVPKQEMEPRDEKSKKVRKAVLEAILTLIRIRADAFGVTDKTTAEQDLASLKKAKLSGPLYYGGLCVQGEKQILQNGLQGYDSFLAEL
ncbi:hypothetical protein BGX33_001771 [Mortierella sp. NVP41]|nr:hypothetical protein BGX33_001771 [Mortierella sp. NVP41]